MPKVAIVTDSTATLPQEYLDQYPIHVLPQVLIWGTETLLDGIDIQPKQFYERLKTDPIHPTTSQVTPVAFQVKFKQLLDEGYEVLSVLVSPKLSGTMESANQAKAMYPDAPIEIVNSESIAMALGFQVLAAARAIVEGASLAECKALVEQAIPLTGVVLTVETLEFLHRGGRIGGGAKFLASALNVKPILEIRDGRVESVERVRTRGKSLKRLVELIEERVGAQKPVRLATLHANAPEEARQLLEDATARLHPVESILAELSPVVGVHAGPGTVGLVFMAGM
ncbi:MAG TPA: DegV family protein [Anaerolineales bacterium]|nr:DegV family protein [Anaerolineales bacterium]